jgi:hypothetical protein
MEKVSGIANIVRNAGTASVRSSQGTPRIERIMRAPTTMRAGAVAVAGIAAASGEKKMARRKSAASTGGQEPKG